MPAFSNTCAIAREGPDVPVPTATRDFATISLPSFRITHFDAVEPTSIPMV